MTKKIVVLLRFVIYRKDLLCTKTKNIIPMMKNVKIAVSFIRKYRCLMFAFLNLIKNNSQFII